MEVFFLKEEFFLRKVNKEDIDLLFNWVNDQDVRKNSMQTTIISYDDHVQWFNAKIQAVDSDLFIYHNGTINIGHIRIDFHINYANINFNIDKNYRRMGHGTKMLKLAEEYLLKERSDITKLQAIVKKENKTSQSCFLKLGYNMDMGLSNDLYFNFYKDLAVNKT